MGIDLWHCVMNMDAEWQLESVKLLQLTQALGHSTKKTTECCSCAQRLVYMGQLCGQSCGSRVDIKLKILFY